MNIQHDHYRIGPSQQGRVAFEQYIAAFNAGKWDEITRFYMPNIHFQIGADVICGREQVIAWCEKKYKKVRENIEVHQVVIDETGMASYVTASFVAHEDAPDFSKYVPLAKGDKLSTKSIVFYRLRDGKIADLRVVRASPISLLERADGAKGREPL